MRRQVAGSRQRLMAGGGAPDAEPAANPCSPPSRPAYGIVRLTGLGCSLPSGVRGPAKGAYAPGCAPQGAPRQRNSAALPTKIHLTQRGGALIAQSRALSHLVGGVVRWIGHGGRSWLGPSGS